MGQREGSSRLNCPIEAVYGTKQRFKQPALSNRGCLWDKEKVQAD
ncbi:hypothetical protein [Ureibacillus aquaedulcis]|uniref:Uncharacterized protein n=1 Tax=Ureibacillus aquaedulcis TaxID=3058421 RepID=A0ABT8GSZ0_9BACL|nr:hypothetical protein [Ureibacillus sp. BA0131]MDN4494533.1 hypothetical protein [Ureibacillus sp. BA0131]